MIFTVIIVLLFLMDLNLLTGIQMCPFVIFCIPFSIFHNFACGRDSEYCFQKAGIMN